MNKIPLLMALLVFSGCMSTMPPLGSSKVNNGLNVKVGTDRKIRLQNSSPTGNSWLVHTGSLLSGALSVGIRDRVEISSGAMADPSGLTGHFDMKAHLFHTGNESKLFRNISSAAFGGFQLGAQAWGTGLEFYELRTGVITSTFCEGLKNGTVLELPLYLYYSKDRVWNDAYGGYVAFDRSALNIGTGILFSVPPSKQFVTFSARGAYRMPISYIFYETKSSLGEKRTEIYEEGGNEFNISLTATFHMTKRRRWRKANKALKNDN